jgi:hypothetical protein
VVDVWELLLAAPHGVFIDRGLGWIQPTGREMIPVVGGNPPRRVRGKHEPTRTATNRTCH